MSPVYYLFLLTFLGYPLVVALLRWKAKVDLTQRFYKAAAILFIIHNVLYFSGWSLRGDIVDYCVFSGEYFMICLAA